MESKVDTEESLEYDMGYKKGYEDGVEQAKYVSDFEVDDAFAVADYTDKVVRVTFVGESNICLISRELYKELLEKQPEEGWTYEFIEH